ncbi:MAG: choice-of-anchor D domain-containing protein [Candidatus Kapaibacterium sp.]
MSTPSKQEPGLFMVFIVPVVLLLLAITDSPAKQASTICAKAFPDTLFRGVTVALAQDSTQCVTITNCGDTTVIFDAYTSLGDYSVSPKASLPLPPDSSFTFCVTFSPKNIGNKHAFLFISAGYMQLYIPVLAGTPCAQLSAAPFSFGLVIAGQTVQKSVVIFNNGDYLWKPGEGYFFPDKGVFSISTPNWDSIVIPAHQSVSLTISYTPKAIETDTATLSFPNAGPCGNDLQTSVSGIGACAHLIEQLYSRPLTAIGETSRFFITLSNSGNLDWNTGIGKIIGADSAVFKLISLLPPIDSAGKQSVLTVEFSPVADRDATAEIIFPDSGPCSIFNSPVSLLGEGACDNIVADDIGTQSAVVGQKKRFLVRITAAGPLGWKPGIPIISGPDSSAFTLISVTPDSVLAGGSVNVTLEFAPIANLSYSATLTFQSSNECADQPLSISLNGIGEADGVDQTSPNDIILGQNYPNPFSTETSFEYTTPAESEIHLTLNDMNGRVLETITTGKVSEGKHLVYLNLPELPSGTYFLLLESGITKSMRELTLLK